MAVSWYFYDERNCSVEEILWRARERGSDRPDGSFLPWKVFSDGRGFPWLVWRRSDDLMERCFWVTVDQESYDAYGNWLKRRVRVCRCRPQVEGQQETCVQAHEERQITYYEGSFGPRVGQ